MMTKAEIGVKHLQTKGITRIAGSHQKLGESHGTDSPLEPEEGTKPVNTLNLEFWPPDL